MKQVQILIAGALIIGGACNNQPDYSSQFIEGLKAQGKVLEHPVRGEGCFRMYAKDFDALADTIERSRLLRRFHTIGEWDDTTKKTLRVCLVNIHDK